MANIILIRYAVRSLYKRMYRKKEDSKRKKNINGSIERRKTVRESKALGEVGRKKIGKESKT